MSQAQSQTRGQAQGQAQSQGQKVYPSQDLLVVVFGILVFSTMGFTPLAMSAYSESKRPEVSARGAADLARRTPATSAEQVAWAAGQNLWWCAARRVRKLCETDGEACSVARYELTWNGKGSIWRELRDLQGDRTAQAFRAGTLLHDCSTNIGEEDASWLKALDVPIAKTDKPKL